MVNTSTQLIKKLSFLAFTLFLNTLLMAQAVNIPCTGYNADVVASGTGAASGSTDNDIDGNGFVFIDNTFKANGGCGLHANNVWKTSQATTGTSGLTYTLQAANVDNDLRLMSGDVGTLNVTTPVSISKLYFLASGGWGDCPTTVTLNFTDGSSETSGVLNTPDWCSGGGVTTQYYRIMRSSTSCDEGLCPYMFELSVNISAINQYRKVASIDFENGVGVGILNVFAVAGVVTTPPACVAPAAQPTSLILTPSPTYVNGSFTASPTADSYLIVRRNVNSLTANPINGTVYSPGDILGGGTVVSFQSGTTFFDGYLAPGTIYYYFIFASNANCSGGPRYRTFLPLSNISTTTSTTAAAYTGIGTWTCPPGVTSVTVQAWGAGGGGGASNGGGGGGGAYVQKTNVAVSVGTTYDVIAGQYGVAGLPLINSGRGGDGGNTSFGTTLVVANGGKGGNGNSGTGGAGGAAVASGGTVTSYKGGNAAAGNGTRGGGGGGGAGTTGAGNNGNNGNGGGAKTLNGGKGGNGTNSGNGQAGSIYGGGGGGGNVNGSTGASGYMVITCNQCPTFTPTFSAAPTDTTCLNAVVTYTTQMGLTNYVWTLPSSGYTIVSGGIGTTSHTVSLRWTTLGSKTVTVKYNNGACTATGVATSTTQVTVNPTVTLSPNFTTCVNSPKAISAIPAGGTGSYTHAWTGTGASSLSTTSSENTTFTNATANTYSLTYTVTDRVGCVATANTSVLVNPMLTLSSSLTPAAICSGGTFNYTATSATGGVSFSWSRAAIPGISNLAGSDASNTISESLINTTDTAINVTYVFTITDANCSNTANVTVTVNPKAAINPLTNTGCSGANFNIIPTNGTDGIVPSGTTYSWSTPSVSGGMTGGSTGTGASDINGTLINPTLVAQTANYNVTPVSGTCTGSVFIASMTINPTPTVIVADGSTCSGGTVTFSAVSNISGSSYAWYQTAVSVPTLGTNAIYTTDPLSANTDFYVAATADGCTSARVKATASIGGLANSTWTGAIDGDWNNPSNWTNGVPCTSTDITIPDVSSPSVAYPTISSAVSCKNITFEPGAAVLGLHNLTYEKAFVKTLLQREKWYTLTAPLKEMYVGDYAFNGSPVVQVKLFDTFNPDSASTGNLYTGTWTRGFSTPTVSMAPGMGFAYVVNQKTYNYPNPITYETGDVQVSFPRVDGSNNLITEYFPYSTYSGRLLTPSWTVTKDPNLAYRFAAENASNQLVDVNYNLNVGLNLIGNPLMTHLDFNKLYAHNVGIINNTVKFWNGTTFTSYMAGSALAASVSSASNVKNIIPPMQAFFVQAVVNTTLTIDIDNDFVADNTMNLRSAGFSSSPEVLHIETDNGIYKSSLAIARQFGASNGFDNKDAFKLFTQIKHVPEVYTLSGDVALDINQFEDYPYTVPLCVKTDSGTVNFNFEGIENFDSDIIIELINTKTGEIQDLREMSQYEYVVDPVKDEGNLFVSFRAAHVATDDNTMIGRDHDIHIFATDDAKIRVISSPNDLIQEVKVFNTTGRTVQHCCVANISSIDIPMLVKNEIYLVQVVTQNSTRIAKVLVK